MPATTTRTRHLTLRYGTSRARDTYGYTIVTLVDTDTAKRYRCNGGGYDMVGTVFAQWLTDTHQDALLPLSGQAYYRREHSGADLVTDPNGLYGLFAYPSENRVSIDGATGLDSVIKIARAAGLEVLQLRDDTRRRNMVGFVVTEPAE